MEQRTVHSASVTMRLAPFCLTLPLLSPLSSCRLLCKAPEGGVLSREQNPALLPGDVPSGPLARRSEAVWPRRPPRAGGGRGRAPVEGPLILSGLCCPAAPGHLPGAQGSRAGPSGPRSPRACSGPWTGCSQGRRRGGRPGNCGEACAASSRDRRGRAPPRQASGASGGSPLRASGSHAREGTQPLWPEGSV